MQNTGNKQFYLICGVTLGQRYQKYANRALPCIRFGQRWAYVSNLFIADSAKVTKMLPKCDFYISTGMHNFDSQVLNPN